jgi:uncharacterized protein
MQDISGLPDEGQQLVNGYGDGGFRISGIRHEGNVLVFPNETQAWSLQSIDELTVDALQAVKAAEPAVEILLIGCGANMAFIDDTVRADFRAAGITIDSMDSGAAVRTYNVLLLEGRRIAAALIAI